MLDGKILCGLTGMPMRNIAFANILLALAEPEPFTFANLITKSLVFGNVLTLVVVTNSGTRAPP